MYHASIIVTTNTPSLIDFTSIYDNGTKACRELLDSPHTRKEVNIDSVNLHVGDGDTQLLALLETMDSISFHMAQNMIDGVLTVKYPNARKIDENIVMVMSGTRLINGEIQN